MEISGSEVNKLEKDGYGISIVGNSILPRTETDGLIRMEADKQFKLLLSNTNCHACTVSIEVDGVHVGSFLLHAYTECELERPADRPLGFIFSPPQVSPTAPDRNGVSTGRVNKAGPAPVTRVPLSCRRTCIVCTFHPEIGGRTLEMDVQAPHLKVSHRIEMSNDCTAQDFFTELSQDFGAWVLEPTCALLHWSTVEYDSPADDVLTSEMQVELWTCKRVTYPIRKMSLVNCTHLHLTVTRSTTSEERVDLHIELTQVATCGTVLDVLDGPGEASEQTWYLLSHTGRFLGSTEWLPRHAFVHQLFHKDEILDELTTLRLQATRVRPPDYLLLFVRVVSSSVYTLEASRDTTIGELRYQLAQRGGPWGEDPCWMFGGTFLESGRPLLHYDLKNKDAVDVFLRLNSACQPKTIIRREPIAVDSDSLTIDTACLIRKEIPAVPKDQRRSKPAVGERPRIQRGGTVLKGRVKQQFVEVDPMEIDSRFKTTLLLSISLDGEPEQEVENVEEETASACELM